MIRSMTGYGRGEFQSNNRRFKVEIKSVNSRFGDLLIKLPRFLNSFEEPVRKRLSLDIKRGKAEVYVHFETFSASDVTIKVNLAFAGAYTKSLRELAEEYELTDGITLSLLASHPEMFTVEKDNYDEDARAELWEVLEKALGEALAQFNVMRETEGAALHKDLQVKSKRIEELLGQIKERSPAITDEYSARLRERITEALSGTGFVPDESRLLTEVALFADRSCIDEEVTRLESHIAQLHEILDGSDPSGRKLDFLVQEFNRETNTLGSKSNDAILTKLTVELKSEIEKIREQVQNIE